MGVADLLTHSQQCNNVRSCADFDETEQMRARPAAGVKTQLPAPLPPALYSLPSLVTREVGS